MQAGADPLKCAFGITIVAADNEHPESQLSMWALAEAFSMTKSSLR